MSTETPWQQALKYANRADPYPFYADMRKTPVSRQPDGSYVVSTYREAVALLHDPRVSSDPRVRHSTTIPYLGHDVSPATAQQIGMITSDPPDHDRVRRVATWHFGPPHTPDLVSNLEDEIRGIAAALLDDLHDKSRIDVVDDFAFPLPVRVICEVLGVPQQDMSRIHALIEDVLNGIDLGPEASSPEQQRLAEVGRKSRFELDQYMGGLLEKYADHPGNGVLSAIVNHQASDEHLSRSELVENGLLLLFAGHETTVNLISHSVLILLRHPEVLDQLRRQPELIIPGIEEFLRLESSVQFWPTRTALADIEIAGTVIPKGSPIFVVYGSANRDPDRFPNPDEVDVEREDNQHVGFSTGIHFCFGAPLARLEAQVAITEFVRRVENPRIVVDPPPYRHSQIFRGPLHLLVDIDAVRSHASPPARRLPEAP
jgi:fatty acid omega-hydroxylase